MSELNSSSLVQDCVSRATLVASRFANKRKPVLLIQTASRYPTAYGRSRAPIDKGTEGGPAGATHSMIRSRYSSIVVMFRSTHNVAGTRMIRSVPSGLVFWIPDHKIGSCSISRRSSNQILEDFDVDPYYVLQAIALRTGRKPQRGVVAGLDVATNVAEWDAAVDGMVDGLKMLRDECGVLTAK